MMPAVGVLRLEARTPGSPQSLSIAERHAKDAAKISCRQASGPSGMPKKLCEQAQLITGRKD